MVYYMDGRYRGKREEGDELASKHHMHFSLSVENERAYAGRDGRTRLVRPNYKAQKGSGKSILSLFSC